MEEDDMVKSMAIALKIINDLLSISAAFYKRQAFLLLQDTPVTPYTRPPVSTDSTTRDRPRDGNLTAI